MHYFSIGLVLVSFFISCSAGRSQQNRKEIHTVSAPDIISSRQWGGKALTDTLPPHKIKRITVHHGGVYFNPDSNVITYLRKLQKWSREKKHWIDIPYHYMIDFQGRIYAARPLRFPGDTNTDYDPRGHALICVIGNFEEQTVNEKQLDSLTALIAWLMVKYHVPIDSVKTHKDYTETLCPGKNLYYYYRNGQIKKRILSKINEK